METMEAGRELDAKVGRSVMGWKHVCDAEFWAIGWNGSSIAHATPEFPVRAYDEFRPSTDIAAAWEVLQAMHRRGLPWVIEQDSEATFPTVHVVNPTEAERASGHVHFIEDMEHLSQTAESPAHAICLAALKAVGG